MSRPRILILEANPSAARVLKIGVEKHIPGDIVTMASIDEAITVSKTSTFDISIINHSIGQDTFSRCFRLKNASRQTKIVVLCAPGKDFRSMEELQSCSDALDVLLEKPLVFPKLKGLVDQYMATREVSIQGSKQTLVEKFVPENIRRGDIQISNGDAFMSERAVLVTDIRRSTQIINQASLSDFFERINEHFTRISELVNQYRGEVIKYTGDGMLACFEGFGRRQLALKCALAIANSERDQNKPFDIGIGIAEGLVMAGFIGSESRIFYDLIGKNVNLAYRLCEQASPNQIIYSSAIHQERANQGYAAQQRELQLAGFDEPVQCYCIFSNVEEY